MITGHVSEDGVPLIALEIAAQERTAIIDTGFNGDLELRDELQGKLNAQPAGRLRSALAGGHVIEEDAFSVDFPFDGKTYPAIATFTPELQILIGTHLLQEFLLQIRFTTRELRLERET